MINPSKRRRKTSTMLRPKKGKPGINRKIDDLSHSIMSDEEDEVPSLKPYEFLTINPKYLLRLCQSGDPRHVRRACQMILKVASSSSTVNDDNDPRVLSTTPQQRQRLLKACRSQLLRRTTMDDDMAFGFVSPMSTPLHLLCGRGGDEDEDEECFPGAKIGAAVQAMLQAADALARHFPDDVDLGRLALLPNQHGETPLIRACRNAASTEDASVIRVLLAYPMGQKSAQCCDHRGNSPMMCLALRYNMACCLQKLMQDSTSFDSFLRPVGRLDKDGRLLPQPRRKINLVYHRMDLMLELIQAAAADRESAVAFSLWQAVAMVSEMLPRSVVDYLFWVAEPPRSKAASLLLPQALAKPRRRDHFILDQQQAYFIEKLIRRVSAASSSDMKKDDCQPAIVLLAKALSSGWIWNEERLDTSTTPAACSPRHESNKPEQEDEQPAHFAATATATATTTALCTGVLQRLVYAHPEGLIQADPETGLFPFQLAATSDMKCHDVEQLDTIYNLLLQAPQQIMRL